MASGAAACAIESYFELRVLLRSIEINHALCADQTPMGYVLRVESDWIRLAVLLPIVLRVPYRLHTAFEKDSRRTTARLRK